MQGFAPSPGPIIQIPLATLPQLPPVLPDQIENASFRRLAWRDILTRMISARTGFFVLICLCLLCAMTLATPITAGGPGATDFVQYWSAWRLILEGISPYNPQYLVKVQSMVVGNSDTVIFSWNPPWAFVALSPVLALPFDRAASLWFALQIVLVLIVSIVAPRGLGRTAPSPLKSVLATMLFLPILDSMRMGQLGVLLAASVALFLYFQRVRTLCFAGISLLPLTFKPHLFFLFFIPGIMWLKQLPSRDRTRFLAGFLGGFGLLLAITQVLCPSALSQWLQALSSKTVISASGLVVHVNDWQTATLVTWIRRVVLDQTETLVTWPMWASPLVSLFLSGLYLYRRTTPIRWETITPTLLCLSLATCNYGWLFDQSLLVLCQIAVVCDLLVDSRNASRVTMLLLLVALQGIALYCAVLLDLPQAYFAWIPWAYLLTLWIARRVLRLEYPAEVR